MAYSRKLRRSQLISPWGVGSIVPFPYDESLIVAGIDFWDTKDSDILNDERLASRLRVNEFRYPPEFIAASLNAPNNSPNTNRFISAFRFPQWFYCPHCKKMMWVELTKDGSVKCNHSNTEKEGDKEWQMIPERFVVACPNGHLMNFPVIEFVHEGSGLPESELINHNLIKRYSGSDSATLAGISYECQECGAKRNLSNVTSIGALKNLTFLGSEPCSCPGYMPWLGNRYEPCLCPSKDLMVVQKGGTNVWFSETRSSIYIPPSLTSTLDQRCFSLAQKIIDLAGDSDPVTIDALLHGAATKNKVDYNELKQCYDLLTSETVTNPYENMTDDEYRKTEYDILKQSSGNDTLPLFCKNISIDSYDPVIKPFFKSVSLVYKMTETRAFIGFSRLQSSNKTIDEFKKQISIEGTDWLPAIQVTGEGIFIEFDKEKIEKWKEDVGVLARAKTITNNYNSSFYGRNKPVHLINPEYVLIHTFAHLLINELSKKCGYGSSALRERLYVSKSEQIDMYGVLIYTASGDSEGSLGGLVREGQPGRLEDSICTCLKEAEWCTADPLCIASKGQGPDSCNLAACHNCSLLPETCCECGNRLLDRGMIIGTDSSNGYFNNI